MRRLQAEKTTQMVSPGIVWIFINDFSREILGGFCVVFDKIKIIFDKRDARSAGLLGRGD